jgi:hypothetical protein
MSHFTALLDANMLHSYPLTSLLLELADARLACWPPSWRPMPNRRRARAAVP